MGAIVVNVGLENAEDRAAFERGLCDEASIRRTEVEGVVDTCAVSLAGASDFRVGYRTPFLSRSAAFRYDSHGRTGSRPRRRCNQKDSSR